MRHAKSRAEELQQRLKQQLEACIPGLWIMGLAVFSLGVGKAYNWKIGMCVLIILETSFAVGYRRLTEK